MSDKTRSGLWALAAAIALGVLGDLFLGGGHLGIGCPLWIMSLSMAVFLISRAHPVIAHGNRIAFLVPAVFFSACLAWHDSATLQGANLLAVVILLALAAKYDRDVRLRTAGIERYFSEIVYSSVKSVLFGPSLVATDITWSEVPRNQRAEIGSRVFRGFLIALPLVLVFGLLMASADAVVEHFFTRALDWDVNAVLTHFLYIVLFACLSAGYFHSLLSKQENVFGSATSVGPKYAVEGIVVLAVLSILFAFFVSVQLTYLFGGSKHLTATVGLTYAQYARRGFFETVWLALLMLPVLLTAHGAVVGERDRFSKPYALFAGVNILLVFAVIASAMKRMGMYMQVYGLTELRLYTTAVMVWLVFVFAWMAATVLTGRGTRFAFGGFVSAFVVLAFLNGVNPDARIAYVNTERKELAKRLDVDYIANLSADAVPALLQALPDLPSEKKGILAERLLHRWGNSRIYDWRSYNRGLSNAIYSVSANRSALKETSETCLPVMGPEKPLQTETPGEYGETSP